MNLPKKDSNSPSRSGLISEETNWVQDEKKGTLIFFFPPKK